MKKLLRWYFQQVAMKTEIEHWDVGLGILFFWLIIPALLVNNFDPFRAIADWLNRE